MHNFTASPPNQHGYFSPQTSAVNFCEIDYAVTHYLAEFINTLSNLAYVYFAISYLPQGTTLYRLPSWPSTNLSLLLVGIGSFAFHASLRHTAQMADELSMYAIISSLNYRVYTHDWFTSPSAKTTLGLVLALATATVGYLNFTSASGADTRIHLFLFIGLITTFWPRVLYLIRHRSSDKAHGSSTRQARLRMFRLANASFFLGLGVWLIDGLFCEKLRAVRAMLGLPLAWALEFHGWWHFLTALGAGMFVKLVHDITGLDETVVVRDPRTKKVESGKAGRVLKTE